MGNSFIILDLSRRSKFEILCITLQKPEFSTLGRNCFVANVIRALGECGVKIYPNLASEMKSCDENGKHNDVIHRKLTAIYNEDNKTDNKNVKAINECITKIAPGYVRPATPEGL